MRANGCEHATIRRAEEMLARYENAVLPLQAEIRAAFADVRLGGGVGLRQARALDDHWDETIAARAGKDDERQDWSALSTETLLEYADAPSFFDAEGMRFHLPAFLLAEIAGDYDGLMFHLTYRDDQNNSLGYHYGRFQLLSAAQRRVVRSFLLLALQDQDYAYECDDIARALAGYWAEPART